MPFVTEHYLLEAFLDGDAYSALADKRRFSTIDNQFNAMTNIIGDGRIDGWEIQLLAFPNVRVTKGSGFIDQFYVVTFDDQDFVLLPSSTYHFYAQRRVGVTSVLGPLSDVASLTYTDTTPPALPTGFAASDPTPSTIDPFFNVELTWTANTEVDLDHYEIERATNPSTNFKLVATVDKSLTTYVDPVDENATYDYELYAVDQTGLRSSAATASHTVLLSLALPPNPMEVTMPASEGAINVLWKRPVLLPLSDIDHWEVTWVRLNPDSSEIPATSMTREVDKNSMFTRLDDLFNGQLYKVTINTVDNQGRISEGVTKIVSPVLLVAPKDPVAISIAEIELVPGKVSISLVWTDGADEYDPLIPYRYNVYVTVEGQQESVAITVPIGETDQQVEIYTFDGVNFFAIDQDSLITLRFTSLSQDGHESLGNYARFFTTNFGQPLPVGNLQSSFNADLAEITVTWDNQPDASYINISVLDDDINSDYPITEIIDKNIGLVEFFRFDAELSHTYTITVTPFDVNGVAGPSDITVEITLIAGGFSPPALPRDLSPQAGDRQVMFAWLASPDFSVVSYRIYKKTGAITTQPADWTLIDTLPNTINRFEDFGLENDQIYSYYVTSVDLYGQESLHLPDGAVNLNFIEIIPKASGIIVEPDNVQLSLVGDDILITWDSLLEEFDSFEIRRSIGNLHLWATIATVDRNTTSYTDENVPLVSGTTFYYAIGKTFNDSDIVVQISNIPPDSAILIGSLVVNAATFGALDVTARRDLLDLEDPISEFTTTRLLSHKHRGIDRFDPDRIDLRPELIVTDWETIDGRIFTTEELDINGTGYVVKIDGRFPEFFFEVDPITRRLIFSEAIVSVDDAGNVTEALPTIEVRVLGVEEVKNELPNTRFDNIHARQVAFGRLNKEQMPPIDHEGRIRETLLPKTFNLERFSDHTFIIPQGNVDTTKNFGNGTTFFSIIEGDGLIDEVIDWDQEDNGDLVGFRRPSFSVDTLLNLKQASQTHFLQDPNDEANEFHTQTDQLFAIESQVTARTSQLYTVDASAVSNVNNIGTCPVFVEDMTIHASRNSILTVNATGAVKSRIHEIDPVTGDAKFIGFIPQVTGDASFGVSAIEYNPNDGILYAVNTTFSRLLTLDLNNIDGSDNIAMTEVSSSAIHSAAGVGTTFFFSMAMDVKNNKMYAMSSFSAGAKRLWTINLSTGIGELVHPTNLLTADTTTATYDAETDKLYALDGFATASSSELYDVDRTTGLDTSLGTFISPNATTTQAMTAGPADQSLWQVPDGGVGHASLNLGRLPGTLADVYLRFNVNVPIGSKLGSATLNLKAFGEHYSVGSISLRVSILNPEQINDTIDFGAESIKLVGTIASQDWQPPDWLQDEDISLDIREIMQVFVNSKSFFRNRHVIIKIETLVATPLDSIRNFYAFSQGTDRPRIELSSVVDVAEVTDDEFFQSEKSYHFAFEFEDMSPTRWVRVTSFDTPIKPNPVIDLKKKLKFKILTKNLDFYLGLGIRELTVNEAVTGSNGGVVGPIEWVGVDEIITDEFGNTAPKGKLITRNDDWQEVVFDLEKETVQPFSTDSNGVLEGKFGVLEHLAFTIFPEQGNADGPFRIYIDKMEQVDDVLVAGTSQGILLSRDFGTSWNSVRLVETPVHKYYKAVNNPFTWAVGANTILLATDLEHWFETSGLTGVQYIRDIVEDDFGNMFISTDKGVYWFEIALINHFSSWRQTQPVNAFTTDCYGLYHNSVASGVDEIWVSTEIGIFKTVDQGETWKDTGMSTQGLPAFQFINISANPLLPNIICSTRKHILRKLGSETDFTVLANFEVQHDIFDIWVFEYFSGRLYVSTGKGVYSNAIDELFVPGITTAFVRVLPGLDINGRVGVAFGLDAVAIDASTDQLFIGQENRIMVASEENVLGIKEQFPNKELPSFFREDTELMIGYVYNAFNNVLIFRSPQPVNKIYRAAHIPRKIFIPVNDGWAHANADADVFIFVNGLPKWLDFKLDEAQILGGLQLLQGKLAPIVGTLDDFNSLDPDASAKLDEVIADITNMISGGDDSVPIINDATIIKFLEDYTRFLSLITNAVVLANDLDVFPKINIAGFPATQRESKSRAELLEEQEDFTANNSTGINIDTVTGEVDFLTIFTTSTDADAKLEFVFNKYDKMLITIFNANISNTGEFTHRGLEDQMEAVNTGLSSHLTRAHYTNLIKAGIFLETNHPFLFDIHKASNIQSKFYSAHTSDWYDIVNSTLDYQSIVDVDNSPESHFATAVQIFTENPYLVDRVWVGTDSDILQYVLDTSTGDLTLEKSIRPGSGFNELFIWDIFVLDEDDIYVVAEEKDAEVGHIFRTIDSGITWTSLETINLPQKFYTFSILNGNKVAGTENGIFFSDNNFGTWFPSTLTLSSQINDDSPSVTAFTQRIRNIETTTFMVAESDRWFYSSGSGLDWFALGGKMTSNNVSVVTKIVRFKSLTWLATDKGLYNDGNSILGESIQFGLLADLESTASASAQLNISDIDFGVDAFYCSAGNKIYRFLDNQWTNYEIDNITSIHKILLRETFEKHWMIVVSHNIITTVNVTPVSGVFG